MNSVEAFSTFIERDKRTIINNKEILDRYLDKSSLKSDSKNLVRAVLSKSFKKMPP